MPNIYHFTNDSEACAYDDCAVHGMRARVEQAPADRTPIEVDAHGNTIAIEGCDRCVCGCKYWEGDVCVDCSSHITKGYAHLIALLDGEHEARMDYMMSVI